MADLGEGRVAVYLDFDNIVISRYDQVNGRSSFQRDKAKGLDKHPDRLGRAIRGGGALIHFPPSLWCRCPRPRPTARTAPTSDWPSTRSKTCSACPTSPMW